MNKEYIKYDLTGTAYNGKYPPDYKKYGERYGGYKNDAAECLFHNFAVQGYDISFYYQGKQYYFVHGNNIVYLKDDKTQFFKNGNEVIDYFMIDGKRLFTLIDELTYVDVY